jgi:hypothetical protein
VFEIGCAGNASNHADLIFRTRVNAGTGGSEVLRLTNDRNVQIANDTGKLQLGASQDLQILHDGTDSIINNATGNLFIRSDSLHLQSLTAENMVVGEANGAVELYHDNNKGCETTTEGLRVVDGTGSTAVLEVKATGTNRADLRVLATGSGDAHIWLDASNGDLSGADYANIYHSSSTGNLNFVNYTNDMEFYVRGGSVGGGALRKAAHFNNNGAVDLYYNDNKKFSTGSNGVLVYNAINIDNELNLQSHSDGVSRTKYMDIGYAGITTISSSKVHSVTGISNIHVLCSRNTIRVRLQIQFIINIDSVVYQHSIRPCGKLFIVVVVEVYGSVIIKMCSFS